MLSHDSLRQGSTADQAEGAASPVCNFCEGNPRNQHLLAQALLSELQLLLHADNIQLLQLFHKLGLLLCDDLSRGQRLVPSHALRGQPNRSLMLLLLQPQQGKSLQASPHLQPLLLGVHLHVGLATPDHKLTSASLPSSSHLSTASSAPD